MLLEPEAGQSGPARTPSFVTPDGAL